MPIKGGRRVRGWHTGNRNRRTLRCPHTARHKAYPCAQQGEIKKPLTFEGRGLLRLLKPRCQSRALFFAGRG